jgi:hypothetical protein
MELAGSEERTRGLYSGLGGIDGDGVGGAPEINAAIRVPSGEEGSKEIRDAFGSSLISRRGGLSDEWTDSFCWKEMDLLSSSKGADVERLMECASEMGGLPPNVPMLCLSLSKFEE